VLVVGLLVGLAVPAVAQNVILNGDFVGDFAGWTPIPPDGVDITGTLNVVYEPGGDALGQSGTGAVFIEWDFQTVQPFISKPVLLSEEAPLDAGADYVQGYAVGDYQVTLGTGDVLFCYPTGCNTLGPLPTTTGYSFLDVPTGTLPTWDTVLVVVEVQFEEIAGVRVAQGQLRLDKVFMRPASEVTPLMAIPTLESVSGLVALFSGAGSGGVSPYPLNFLWDFGDSGSSMEQNPEHPYPAVGEYVATLTVDAGFEEASATVDVDLTQPSSVLEVPAVSSVGLALLALLLAVCGALAVRRLV
jgi:hypothetical protein